MRKTLLNTGCKLYPIVFIWVSKGFLCHDWQKGAQKTAARNYSAPL